MGLNVLGIVPPVADDNLGRKGRAITELLLSVNDFGFLVEVGEH